MLDNLYIINNQIKKKNFDLKTYLRATITKNYKPYFKVDKRLLHIS